VGLERLDAIAVAASAATPSRGGAGDVSEANLGPTGVHPFRAYQYGFVLPHRALASDAAKRRREGGLVGTALAA
jgi:hypothetical protein